MSSPTTNNKAKEALALELAELPPELQANVNAVLGVFNQGNNPTVWRGTSSNLQF